MFTLYMRWYAERELAPSDIQFILSPRDALDMASIFYELDYLEYDQRNRATAFCLTASRSDGEGFTTDSQHNPTNASVLLNTTDSMMR